MLLFVRISYIVQPHTEPFRAVAVSGAESRTSHSSVVIGGTHPRLMTHLTQSCGLLNKTVNNGCIIKSLEVKLRSLRQTN